MAHGQQTRSFIIILGITALVWLALSLSERHEYPLQLQVRMQGYDSVRYAVVERDTVLVLQGNTIGFNALRMSLRKSPMTVVVNMAGSNVRRYATHQEGRRRLCRSVAVGDIEAELRRQLSPYALRDLTTVRDSLRLVLAERSHKTVRVSLRNLTLSFAEGYGLYGNPEVSPSEVTLYGPSEVLEAIDEVGVAPVAYSNLTASRRCTLAIEPLWDKQDDVHCSADTVALTLAVEPFVERQFSLPVSVPGADTTQRLHLYPDHVTVDVWIPQRELAQVSAERFSAVADYRDIQRGASSLPVTMARFPNSVRLRSVSPAQVQYVIIK